MRVVTLLENDSESRDLAAAHGLSLYIEHNQKKILFDIGPGKQYLKNAEKLGIDISDIDICVISHGHSDHGKRIDTFLRINKKANVYISNEAFGKFYKKKRRVFVPIGISKPTFSKRIVEIDDDLEIEPGINIIMKVPFKPQIITDDTLMKNTADGYMPDSFKHEIYMVLHDDTKRVLFSGCSHRGIENIINTIEENENKPFTTIVGGFHFSHFDSGNLRQSIYLEKLSEKFNNKGDVEYYTGHCTGDEAYTQMKNTMKASLHRFKTGTEFKL